MAAERRGSAVRVAGRRSGVRGGACGRGAARGGEGGDGGFTLIELMVVILVIAILLAIAIPTFLGARQRAQDRAAQSSLRNALTAAKVAFVDHGDYRNATHTGLADIEPALRFVPYLTHSTDPNQVSVHTLELAPVRGRLDQDLIQIWAGAARSDSGTCWYIADNSSPWSRGAERRGRGGSGSSLLPPGTSYGSAPPDGADCNGWEAWNETHDDGWYNP